MQPIARTRQVNIIVPANAGKGSQLLFPVVMDLRNKRITGVEVMNEGTTLSFADNGIRVANTNELLLATLTLVNDKSDEIHRGFPMNFLDPVLNLGIYRDLEPTVLDLQKSYVRINEALPAGGGFNYTFLFHYLP